MGSIPEKSGYEGHHQKFGSEGLPKDEAGWIARAEEVSDILAKDAAQRDIANKSPVAEVALLKSSGLLKLLGPSAFGGGGQSWSTAYKAIRTVAQGDGSLGMLLGYHLLWSTTANVVGTDEQKTRIQKQIIENNWFIGGAVNPRDADLSIASEGEELVFSGHKFFNTGGVVSDVTVLEGVLQGTDLHIFAFVPTRQEGIVFGRDWDNVGLRLTESGSVKISNVRAPWKDALGWDAQTKQPIESVLKIPFASLLLPTIQLVFANFYLGIAQGALEYAKAWTNKQTRAWPYGGDNKESPLDEFYILSKYGNFKAHLLAAEALADRAGSELSNAYLAHQEKRDITARQRGEIAEWVASVKIVATDTGLRVSSGVFEVTGAKSTQKKVGLDRFWRDIRTHTLHDPVAYKERELGRFVLLDEIPEPTWYT